MMRIQLNITLKYSMMNELIIKKKTYLSARERYNIIREDNKNDETTKTTRQIKLSFHSFVLSSSK